MSLITDHEPTLLVNAADRRMTYRWVVRRVEDDRDPATLVVNLKVSHRGQSKEFYAELRNATETDRGVSIERFGWNDPVWHRRQAVTRYSRKGLRAFAEQSLAALRQADTDGEPLHVDLADTPPADTGDGSGGGGAQDGDR